MNIPKFQIRYKNQNFFADSKELMIANICKYFDNRNISIDILEIKEHVNKNIQNSSLGNSVKIDEQEKRLNKIFKGRLSFSNVVAGARAFLSVVGGSSVTQEEINRRSSICQGCVHKQVTTDCFSCGFGGTLNKFINEAKVRFGFGFELTQDAKKSYCEVCSCALSLMLPSKTSSFKTEDEDKQKARPDFCWVKKGSDNFINS